ncbi:MAG: hypothetical protein R3C03_05500 [Pirellulaceae bacterium]
MGPDKDTRLKAFARQGAAILASEGGWNSASIAKLSSLGQHLRLTESETQSAIESLKSSNANAEELTRYEVFYVEFLHEELAKLRESVLTLPVENLAIDIAQSKYQIEAARARLLLEQQAEKLGVKRVSASDAEAFVEEVVVEELAGATFLEDEQSDRLSQLASSWGVPEDRTRHLIERTIEANWRLLQKVRREAWAWKIVWTLCGLMVVGVIGFWVWWYWGRGFNSGGEFVLPDPVIPDSVEKSSFHSDSVLSGRYQRFLELNPTIADAIRTMGILNDGHQEALESIFNGLLELDLPKLKPADGLLVDILKCESDINVVKSFLANRTWPPKKFNTVQEKNVDEAKYVFLFSDLSQWNDDQVEPSESLKNWRFSLVGVDRNTANLKVQLRAEWFRRQTMAFHERVRIAPDTQELELRSWVRVAEFFNLDSKELKPIVESAGELLIRDLGRWDVLEPDVEFLLKDLELDGAEIWLEIADRLGRKGERLKRLLATRLNLLEGADANSAVESLTSTKQKLRRQRFQQIVTANDVAARGEDIALLESPELIPDRLLAEEWVKTMWAVNQSLAAWQLAQGGGRLSTSFESIEWTKWEALRQQMGGGTSSSIVSAMTESQRRDLKRIELQLADAEPEMSEYRILELQRLSEMVDSLDELDWNSADVIATYFLRAHPLAERNAINKCLLDVRIWNRLLISLADNIGNGEITADDALTMLQIVFARDVQFQNKNEWRIEFADWMMRRAVDSVADRFQDTIEMSNRRWQFARRYLYDSFRIRQQILKLDSIPLDPETMLLSAVEQVNNRSFTDEQLSNRTRFVAQQFSSEMEFELYCVESFAQAVAEKAGQGAPTQENLKAIPLGVRFLLAEQRLLRSLHKARSKAFDELMKTGGY